MNRFLGIALEMVFNRHRRREILFWWLYFFFFFLRGFLALSCSTLFYGNAQSRRRGAKEAPAESMLETLFTCISGLLRSFNCKHCDPELANISLLASAFLPQTTSGNDIQQLLPLTRYNTFVPPWIRKTQITTQTIRKQKTHIPREKNLRVVLSCVVRPGVLLSSNAKTLPSSAARNAEW